MPERHTAAVALGSNLPSPFGSPEQNLLEAIARIRPLGCVLAISSFLITAPVGYTAQPDFVNAALLLETPLAPLELLRALLSIEQAMGRTREGVPAKGPRIIDLDLIFVDGLIMSTPELTLPHPAMSERAFVLTPLAQVAPDWIHPALKLTVQELKRSQRQHE
jgi:2-amino-4-hydroxy-6-hydroxymethyldihydropteridine diphosphokinase